eukprot:CAMPEP_0114482404 /NCGR_PEP_ID=MMETSP0104-20121206/18240_1 /TAXON_ID=37642 ORGANISM="Paraphysomonas imperforata, Strain PA2" /NCGR_SAMPLE_ID=MMETSP0104 /ASSEMBLY_ACC=CAM_ASM_000202 /LENGTH=123 /DNA_ID=CAMNT_0001658139 /DNA_START=18 /DNA_END=385 /DNA_ORIENTATION=+
MLQEFLVNELNHTEELQASLRNVKEELNVTVKQRENYKKKCESQLAELEMLTVSKAGVGNNNHASQMSQSAADSQTMLLDQMLMGKFIGKKFAGYGMFYAVVATYQKPYYKVVYEDGDCEDLT